MITKIFENGKIRAALIGIESLGTTALDEGMSDRSNGCFIFTFNPASSVRQQNEAKPPSWEDSRQQLTAVSPPQWPRDETIVADEEEEEEDEDDESTIRLRNYLSSLRDSTKVSVLLKTCQ